jgi:sulfite exporter TauE/SafE
VLGALWGLTPCALVYGVLPLALLSGGVWQGALIMLAFGVGTLPNLLAAGWALSRMKRRLEAKAVRWAAGAIVAVFALAGLWRALFVPASLGAGPFCLI